MNKNLKSLYIVIPTIIIVFFGLAYSILSIDSIADYDELAYVIIIQKIINFLHNLSYYSFDASITNLPLSPTNLLHSYVLSIFELIVPHSVAIFTLHTLYLFFLIFILNKFFDKKFVGLVIIVLASNYYFTHLYGTFVSEYSVGILLICITVLSFFDYKSEYNKWLILSIVLFIMVRVINLVFIAGFLGIIISFYFVFNNKDYLKNVLKSYLYALMLVFPFILPVLPTYIEKIYNGAIKQVGTAANWRDMTGIESKLDIPLYIFNTTTYYMPYLFISAIVLSFLFLVKFKRDKHKLKEFIAIFSVLMMVLFAFSNANSSHPLLVFWFYSLLSLLTVYAIYNLAQSISNKLIVTLYIFGLLNLISVSFVNYSQSALYHENRQDIYSTSVLLAKELDKIHVNQVFTNYAGIGPLDLAGINLSTKTQKKGYKVDKMGYDKDTKYFIEELQNANILILANKNFLWEDYSKFINVNRYTNEIYEYVDKNFEELGFFRYKKIYYSDDSQRYFEIFTKQYVDFLLPYKHIKGDAWLGTNNTIRIFPRKTDFSNKQLIVNVEIPCIENHNPPFSATLVDDKKTTIDIALSEHCGNNKMIFDLNKLEDSSILYLKTKDVFKSKTLPFKFTNWITEPFSSKGTPDRVDTRKLTYYYKSSEIVDKHIKKVKGFYSDGWVEKEALIRVYKHNKQQTIYGVIPVEALSLLPINISIKSKDANLIHKVTQVGDFKINIPEIKEDQEMKITTDKSFDLPSPDTRHISWRLLKWEK